MFNLPGNPHHDVADSLKREYPLTADKEALNWPLAEINERLAALAFEQRTATLVHALLGDSLVTDGNYDEIQAEVRKRLGLKPKEYSND